LEKSKYSENTIVFLLSDHGFHVGEKGHWQKGTLWEDGTNCLLMVRAPGITRAGTVSTTPVSLLDLYPTIAELTGIQAPDYLDGFSIVNILKNPQAKRPEPAISAYNDAIAVRSDNYRLIRYGDGTMEFYDHSKDPNEWTNQANNPEYKAVLQKVLSRMPAVVEMAPKKVRGKDND
ncbi:MAG: sulfatase/phosphatase domain-containing protein, partial [Opitutales bacterium]